MDFVVRTPRLPAAGETILGGPFDTSPGGKGANQAVAAARMGADVMMIGRVGADAYGGQMRDVLAGEGVDVANIIQRADAATGVALITVDDAHGENTIVVAGGANRTLAAVDVDAARAAIEAADVLLMQLEIPVDTVAHAIGTARSADVRIVLNAAPGTKLPETLLEGAHVLIVNRGEAAMLAGADVKDDPAEIAERLAATGAAAVAITLGAEGALLCDGSGARRIPAAKVEPVDTVGAGDAFAGALAAALARGAELDEAGRLASAAGALATTRRGAIPSLPGADEVKRLVATIG
jgi:ribokinase